MNITNTLQSPYSISLKDKARNYKIEVTDYPVTPETGRKYYFQFIQLWGKKVRFHTSAGDTVEGYLHKVNGEYSY